jgi:gamma-glutamylcyclotransferase (GGCT)/AIG2-like uncharacterized protein YtfP
VQTAPRRDDDGAVSITHLFVYGTLRPGEVRWSLLQPFVNDHGIADEVDGELYDTGLDYPAAVFGGTGRVVGQTFELITDTLDHALAVLDEYEETGGGMYRRVAIHTRGGRYTWAYEYGADLTELNGGRPPLSPITSGDWFIR